MVKEKVTMDFVSGLPRTPSGYDSIWVIVDRLTKSAHFLPIKKTDGIEKLAQLPSKSFAECKKKAVEFNVGDKGLMLKVSPFEMRNCFVNGKLDIKLHFIEEPRRLWIESGETAQSESIPLLKFIGTLSVEAGCSHMERGGVL
ncbi:putative reverse transcriptase domain-containing protein [Tanacetum coccineum]